MQSVIEKAEVLIEALPYIQRFRGQIVVIKVGGSAMEDPATVKRLLTDIAFMECVGMLTVIVHGGGKAISRGMRDEGIDSRFLHGLRITCEKSIEVVQKVIKGEVNPGLVKTLCDMGASATGIHGEDIFRVKRKQEEDPDTGETLDWGFVGEPSEVAVDSILELLSKDEIPVITPLGLGLDDKVHNMKGRFARPQALVSRITFSARAR